MERLFSTDQVAELLGVTTWVVSTWMRQGMLKAQQLPQGLVRVSERNLVSFLRAQHIDLGVMMKDIASSERTEDAGTRRRGNAEKERNPVFPLTKPAEPSRPARPAEPPTHAVAVVETSVSEQQAQQQTDVVPRASQPAVPRPAAPEPRPTSAADDTRTPLPPDDGTPPIHAAQQVLKAVLRDALARRAQGVQFTLDGQELSLALRVDGRLHGKPHFHDRLPQGLGREIVAYALEHARLPEPAPLSSGELTLRFEGREVTVPAWACRIGETTRLVFTLPGDPPRVGDLLPVGHARTLHKALENRSGLILLAGPMDRCRRLLGAVRGRLEETGRSTLELPRSASLDAEAVRAMLTSPERSGLDALLVEEFSRYDDVSAVLDGCRGALIVAVVPENSPAGLAAFLRQANAPAWDLARGLSAVGVLDAEGGVVHAVDSALREKIRTGQWDWGL